jgi:hypothetical protein
MEFVQKIFCLFCVFTQYTLLYIKLKEILTQIFRIIKESMFLDSGALNG